MCICLTSSEDRALCHHARSNAGPKDWAGGEIALKYNWQTFATLPRGFRVFEHCIDEFDVANDIIQLQSSTTDGVCITGLFLDLNRLLVGKNNNLRSFWIDGNDHYCRDDFRSSPQITIQNGQVKSSICKP